MRNLLTIDVEEYFQVEGFADVVGREAWDCYESRVVPAVERLLRLLDETDTKATFFVLAWSAERHPEMVRRIVEAGHELASHGYGHRMLDQIGEDGFRQDLRRSRRILEDVGGVPLVGYRAPSFSVTRRTPWAHAVLAEEGFCYSSSVFPVHHDRYGIPDAPRTPWEIDVGGGRSIVELPPLTLRVGRSNLPVGGGGYLRLFPVGLVSHALRRMNARGAPGVIYLHPWEVDPEQPRLPGRLTNRFRHYVGLRRTERKLRHLLQRFDFGTTADFLGLDRPPLRETPDTARDVVPTAGSV